MANNRNRSVWNRFLAHNEREEQTMTLKQARKAWGDYLAWQQTPDAWQGGYPCRHGHYGCSHYAHGPCSDEVMSMLLIAGEITNDGNWVEDAYCYDNGGYE